MACKPRSLSELPGHLRVPILKRKDTGRTRARLEAGLAGMEELRVLREQQQQLVGDTVARVENRQQRPHHRRHSDNGLMTSGNSKMTRPSAGPSKTSSHNAISSWQSASSLAIISEEGDNNAVDKNNNNGVYPSHKDKILKYATDNYYVPTNNNNNNNDNNLNHSNNNKTNYYNYNHYQGTFEHDYLQHNPNSNQTTHSYQYQRRPYQEKPSCTSRDPVTENDDQGCYQKKYNVTSRTWWSQEDLRQYSKRPNDNSQSSLVGQHTYQKGRHDTSQYDVSGEPNLHSSEINKSRRYSTSTVMDSQPRKHPRSMSSNSLYSKGSVNSVPNFQIFSEGESSTGNNFHCKTHANNQPGLLDSNRRQISWDNLLKNIGISNSTTSLVALGGEEDEEETDNVFNENHVSNQDKASFTERQIPFQKVGRSFSFSCANSTLHSRDGLGSPQQIAIRNNIDGGVSKQEVVSTSLSSQSFINRRQGLQPIMRRASMQCEAVLTNSGIAKRIVNPIQDVDINKLTSPGPLHAIMLQYTSRELTSAPVNGSNSTPDGRSKNLIDKNRDFESKNKHSNVALDKEGKNRSTVILDAFSRDAKSQSNNMSVDVRTNQVEHFNTRLRDNNLELKSSNSQRDISRENDIKRTWSPRQDRSKKRTNINRRRDSKDKNVDKETTSPDSVTPINVKVDRNECLKETDKLSTDSSFSKPTSVSSDSVIHALSNYVNGDEHNLFKGSVLSSDVEESSRKGSNLENLQILPNSHNCDATKVLTNAGGDPLCTNGNAGGVSLCTNDNAGNVPICTNGIQLHEHGYTNGRVATKREENVTDVHINEKTCSPIFTKDPINSDDIENDSKTSDIQLTNHRSTANTKDSISFDIDPHENYVTNTNKYGQNIIPQRCHNDVTKLRYSVTSSDISVISDEGYNTCESVSQISKLGSSVKRNELCVSGNSLSKSTPTATVDEIVSRQDQGRLANVCKNTSGCKQQDIPTIPEPAMIQPLPEKREFYYESVKSLEDGAALVWNPECSTDPIMHRRNMALKSCKQTAV